MTVREFLQAMYYFSNDVLKLYRRHVEALETLAGMDAEAEAEKRVSAAQEAARGLAGAASAKKDG